MASEYDFIPIFTATPFSSILPNGDQQVNGLLLPTYVPDGTPDAPRHHQCVCAWRFIR